MSSTPSALPEITYTQVTKIPRASSLAEFRELVEKEGKPVAYRLKEDEKFPAFEKWNEEYFSNSKIQVLAHQCTTPRNFDVVNSSVLQLALSAIKHPIALGSTGWR